MTKADKIRRYLKKKMAPMDIVRKLDCHASEVYRIARSMKKDHVVKQVPVVKTNDVQIGGDHYKKYGSLQPWDVWTLWGLNPFQAAILKYVVRYKDKEGVKDLEKARHFLDKLIEVESGK